MSFKTSESPEETQEANSQTSSPVIQSFHSLKIRQEQPLNKRGCAGRNDHTGSDVTAYGHRELEPSKLRILAIHEAE